MRSIESGSAEKCAEQYRTGDKANKCLYEGVIVLTALCGAGAWGMRSAERRKVNVLEMKYLRSLVRAVLSYSTIVIIIIIIKSYHDFLPTPSRGSQVKSDKAHTQSSRCTP